MDGQDNSAPLYVRFVAKLVSPFRGEKRDAIVNWEYQRDYFTYCLFCTAPAMLFFVMLFFDVIHGAVFSKGYLKNEAGLIAITAWLGFVLLAILTSAAASLNISSILAGRDIELERRMQKLIDGEQLEGHELDFRNEDTQSSAYLAQRLVELDEAINNKKPEAEAE